jgi:S1-C subfamily serine protease
MKLLTVIALTMSVTATWAQDIINTHQHLVFDYATVRSDAQKANVYSRINNQVPGHSTNFITVEAQGKPTLNFDIPLAQFKLEKSLAKSVFIATTGTGTARGTAFLIGKDFVLTNKHVLANDKECRKFGIDLNHVHEFVPCQRVLHCSSVNDFCLVQLDVMNNGKSVGEEIAPLKFATSQPQEQEFSLLIGNPYDAGIHAASYKRILDAGNDWGHFNRAFSGNSGSPLLNQRGEVIGIHYGRGQNAAAFGGPNDRDVGLAVKSSVMISEMRTFFPEEFKAQAPKPQKKPSLVEKFTGWLR